MFRLKNVLQKGGAGHICILLYTDTGVCIVDKNDHLSLIEIPIGDHNIPLFTFIEQFNIIKDSIGIEGISINWRNTFAYNGIHYYFIYVSKDGSMVNLPPSICIHGGVIKPIKRNEINDYNYDENLKNALLDNTFQHHLTHFNMYKKNSIETFISAHITGKKFKLINICGDGNCQFRSIRCILSKGDCSRESNGHAKLRENMVSFMKRYANFLKEHIFSPNIFSSIEDKDRDTYEKYIEIISNDRVWGDHISLMAISLMYDVIFVLISDDLIKKSEHNDANIITLARPTIDRNSNMRIIGHYGNTPLYDFSNVYYLYYISETHYNALMMMQ